jgi:hypothetical protein
MAEKSAVRCTTPSCVITIAKYGGQYHMVSDITPAQAPKFMPDAKQSCGYCGGYFNGTTWKHACMKCGVDVEPGTLVGLFVPHQCTSCKEKERAHDIATGNICGLCRKPRSECVC